MVFSINLTAQARADLREVHTYISEKLEDPTSATKIVHQILSKIDTLELFPHRGDIFTEAKPEFGEIRTAKTKTHLILYAISDHPPVITIHRIIHAHRNLSIVL